MRSLSRLATWTSYQCFLVESCFSLFSQTLQASETIPTAYCLLLTSCPVCLTSVATFSPVPPMAPESVNLGVQYSHYARQGSRSPVRSGWRLKVRSEHAMLVLRAGKGCVRKRWGNSGSGHDLGRERGRPGEMAMVGSDKLHARNSGCKANTVEEMEME